MTAFCSLVGRSRLTCGESLSRRPIGPLVDSLRQLGVECKCANGYPPVEIGKKGIRGGETSLPGDVSSQFISALLFVSPFTHKTTIHLTTPLQSKSYVLLTQDTQKKFGIEIKGGRREFTVNRQRYTPTSVSIEGDWSSASLLLAAGALSGNVEVGNLNFSSLQADKNIVEILKMMGAKMEVDPEKKSIAVKKSDLRPINVNVSNCPDLFPVICALAANARGMSRIRGIERLKIKESDRVELMKEGLKKMGAKIETNEEVIIKGSALSGATIDPGGDHRIAMTFAVLGLVAKGTTLIEDARCVAKSFPGFWDKLKELNCEVVNG
jgi:3-phosphoshikimate 1-carboxyvinyltransferase